MAETGDPTLKVRVEGDISQLEGKLKEAEKVVEKSGGNMGQAVDKSITKVADNLGKKIAKMIGAGFAVKALDDSLKIIAEGIRHGKGAEDIALAIGDSIIDALRKVPVAGALGDILAMVFDSAFGDPEAMKKAREKYTQSQLQGQERKRLLSDIRLQGATPEEAVQIKAERDIEALQRKLDQAESTIQATQRVFMQKEYEDAVSQKLREIYPDQYQEYMANPRRYGGQLQYAQGQVDREQFYQVGKAYSPEAREELKTLREAFEKSKAEIERRAAEELSRLQEREQRAAQQAVPPPESQAIPTESEVEEAVRDLEEEMEMQGADTSIFETKLLTYAQDQLTTLKDIASTLDRMSRQEVGLN